MFTKQKKWSMPYLTQVKCVRTQRGYVEEEELSKLSAFSITESSLNDSKDLTCLLMTLKSVTFNRICVINSIQIVLLQNRIQNI